MPLLPHAWMKLTARERADVSKRGRHLLAEFEERLAELHRLIGSSEQDAWLCQVKLFGVYFDYQLRRLELFAKMHDLAARNQPIIEQGDQLSASPRQELLALHREIYSLAEHYDSQAANVPGNMMQRTRALHLTKPFKEFVAGYDPSLDGLLQVKQFAGTVALADEAIAAGEPFTLRIRLRNMGVCPWMEEVGHQLELEGDLAGLSLPAAWKFEGPPVVYGDQREVKLQGVAPREPGSVTIRVRFTAPYRNPFNLADGEFTLRWE